MIATEPPAATPRTLFVNFLLLKLNAPYRALQSNEKLVAKQEFLDAFERYSGKTTVLAYSLVGLRADCELLLWRVDPDLSAFQEMSARLLSTGIGKYLSPAYSFLSATARPESQDALPLEPAGAPKPEPGRKKYLFLHPFVKSRRWYELPRAERQKVIEEQIRIRAQHPGVVLHTTYSFGLDEQEYMMAFEADEPGEFMQLAAQLRESGWGAYTLRDTPSFTCAAMDLREILDTLG